MLEVAEAGEYEFELRRWPKEIDRPLTAPSEEGQGAIPITQASFYLSNYHHLRLVKKVLTGSRRNETGWANDTSVTFTAKLDKGPIALHTWFRGSDAHRSGTGSTILSATMCMLLVSRNGLMNHYCNSKWVAGDLTLVRRGGASRVNYLKLRA